MLAVVSSPTTTHSATDVRAVSNTSMTPQHDDVGGSGGAGVSPSKQPDVTAAAALTTPAETAAAVLSGQSQIVSGEPTKPSTVVHTVSSTINEAAHSRCV